MERGGERRGRGPAYSALKTTIHPEGSGPATADDDETSLEGRQREARGCGRGGDV